MERKLCFCKTCGKVSIDTRKNSKSSKFTPIESENEIIADKDMNGEIIYLCSQCKDENFAIIKSSDDLISMRANYLTKESKRKEEQEKSAKRYKELVEKADINDDEYNSLFYFKGKKVKSPFSGEKS